jgi:hypothetical protein
MESKVQVEQVQKEHGAPQATSCVDTNISFEQGNPDAFNQYSLSFILNLALLF